MEMTRTGVEVYNRTYARTMKDGTTETWADTVARVVSGNCGLVDKKHILPDEEDRLYDLIYDLKLIPGGRHLFMSGVEGRQFVFNCWNSHWTEKLSDHFSFTFLRLMEGGGVGTNYSSQYLQNYKILHLVKVGFLCRSDHPDRYLMSDVPMLEDVDSTIVNVVKVDDSREGWAAALTTMIDCVSSCTSNLVPYRTHQYGGLEYKIVFDVSDVRPLGSPIKTFGGTAAGPLPLMRMLVKAADILNDMWLDGVNGPSCMELDHSIAECVVVGNVRRSARMSVMHWKDPFIHWFLGCKKDTSKHWSTNISVAVDDEFIRLLKEQDDTDAHKVYVKICEGMVANGEPGIWNQSLSNTGEPTWCHSPNACGEIPLAPWEPCNLGHVNLAAFFRDAEADWTDPEEAHVLMTRFLLRATFGDVEDPKSKAIISSNRKIGVGHLGFQWFAGRLGLRYGIEAALDETITTFLTKMKSVVDETASKYARELGIPTPIKTTTVAPTGTIAKLPGVTEGIHPIYARHFIRRIRFTAGDPRQQSQLDEYARLGYKIEDCKYSANTKVVSIPSRDPILDAVDPDLVVAVNEIGLHELLAVQQLYQDCWADNAVSFTANVPEGKYSACEVGKTMLHFLSKLKGTTLMPDGTRPQAPYERITEEEYLDLTANQPGLSESSSSEECKGSCPVR